MIRDLRQALPMLSREPGVALVAITTLAIGIGATSTMFTAVNAVLLRDLPVEDPDRIVRIFAEAPGFELSSRFSTPITWIRPTRTGRLPMCSASIRSAPV